MRMTIKEAAALVGKSVKTLYKYKSEGCNIEDEKELKAWAEKKALTARGKSKVIVGITPGDQIDIKNLPEVGSEGAPQALKRLQRFERLTAQRFELALAGKDALAIKTAREDHTAVAATLMKYEKEIEQHLRDSGELISRRDMLNGIAAAANWMRLGFVQWISASLPDILALADNPRAAKAKIIETFPGSLVAAIRQESRLPVPRDVEALIAQEFRLQELKEPGIIYRSDLGWCQMTPLADIPIEYPTQKIT